MSLPVRNPTKLPYYSRKVIPFRMPNPAPFGILTTSAVETLTDTAKRRSKRCVVFLCLAASVNIKPQTAGRHRGQPLRDVVASPFCHGATTPRNPNNTNVRPVRIDTCGRTRRSAPTRSLCRKPHIQDETDGQRAARWNVEREGR